VRINLTWKQVAAIALALWIGLSLLAWVLASVTLLH